MGKTDEKYLVMLFTALTAVLIIVLMWNIRARSNVSTDQIANARKDFVEQVPRILINSDLELNLERIEPDINNIAEVVVTANSELSTSGLANRVKEMISGQFEIIDQSVRDSVAALGVAYYGHPVGKVIIYGENRTYAPATIGLIIDDFGYYDDETTDGFLSLSPERMSFAVIPGHQNTEKISRVASENGFEIMIHMPMEPMEYEGGEDEFIILEGMSSRQIISRMNKAIGQLPMAAGLNNHQGSRATQDPNVMQPMLYLLRDQNMFFVDSFTSPESVGYELAQKIGVPSARRTVFLDNEQDVAYIKQQLRELVDIAREQRYALGIGHAKEITLQVLRQMIPEYERQNVQFTRASGIVHLTTPAL
ncbi:MAG: hypothetical protein GF372_08255 [Candidatus Marinimicrobia bacterium]|nr:hypothetical protein [Candidatus Neomarinimicrobiota bacterium]